MVTIILMQIHHLKYSSKLLFGFDLMVQLHQTIPLNSSKSGVQWMTFKVIFLINFLVQDHTKVASLMMVKDPKVWLRSSNSALMLGANPNHTRFPIDIHIL